MDNSPTSPIGSIFRRLSSIRKGGVSIKRRLSRKSSSSMDKEENKEEITVTKIRDYIKNDDLRLAYLNLLSLRQELQQEQEALVEEATSENLSDKDGAINLLFDTLKKKMTDIVRSSTQPSVKKEALNQVVSIILEEEKKPEMDSQGWRNVWRSAVREGVKDTLKKVPLDSCEQNIAWLAMHFHLLDKAIEEDLDKVKTELQDIYPQDFNVFETYVSCHHEIMIEHLMGLLEKVTVSKDYHNLLDFTVRHCVSDVKKEESVLKQEQEFISRIKNTYHHQLMEDFKAALERIISIERDEVWKMKKTPEKTDDGLLISNVHMDICQIIASYAGNLKEIDDKLEKLVVRFCLEELHQFHNRFAEEFTQNTKHLQFSEVLDVCLWVEYHITYINTFLLLKDNVQCYKESFSAQVEKLEKDVDELTQRFSKILMDHFKNDIKPFLNGMMTRKWLKEDEDFTEITSRIEIFSGLCKCMRKPAVQVFVNDVHYYVIREYVSQLMKKKYSCKNSKNEEAATKLRTQWIELTKLFSEMGSSLDWLYPLGNHLSDIIGKENEKNIKDVLNPLVNDYPDISKKQVAAILYFRDSGLSWERHQVMNKFKQDLIKRDTGNIIPEHNFFSDME